ncbi:DUF1206 domain-containing protein [Zhihengliuella alba]
MTGTAPSQRDSGDSRPVEAARSAAHDGRFAAVARSGYATSGLLHMVLGWLTAIVASGGSASADYSGALQAVAAQPFGVVALVLAGAACALLGLWNAGRAVFGRDGVRSRLGAAGTTAVYLVIGLTVLRYAFGARSSASQSTRSLSAELMTNPLGSGLLIATGAVILIVAGYHVFKGVARKFLDDLKGLPNTPVRGTVTVLGTAGYVAKGLVLGALGLLFVVATVQHDPSDSSGLDGAVQAVRDQPFGPSILLALAIGLVLYGAYQIVRARYDTME